MRQRKPVILSLLTAMVWLFFPLLFAIIGYATFVVPTKIEGLKAQGIKELPTGYQLLVDLSDLCKSRWFVVFPLLLILAVVTSRLLTTSRGKNV